MTIPKTLVECGILKEGAKVDAVVNWNEASPFEPSEPKPLKKKALEALQDKSVFLSLNRASTPGISSYIEQEWPAEAFVRSLESGFRGLEVRASDFGRARAQAPMI